MEKTCGWWFLESDTVYSAVRECQERLVGSVKKIEEDPGGETSNPQNSWKEKENNFIAYDASIVFLPVSIALLFSTLPKCHYPVKFL
jgi:hypothetical protein